MVCAKGTVYMDLPFPKRSFCFCVNSNRRTQVLASCWSPCWQGHPPPQWAVFLNTATLCFPPTFHTGAVWGSPLEPSPWVPGLQTGSCPYQGHLLLQNWAGQWLIFFFFPFLLSFGCLKITLINFVESLVCSHHGIALCADLLHAIFRYGFWNTMWPESDNFWTTNHVFDTDSLHGFGAFYSCFLTYRTKTDILICLVRASTRFNKYLWHWFKLNLILLFLL